MKKLSVFIVTLMVIVLLAAVESQAGRNENRYSRQDNTGEQRERALRDGHISSRERMMLERRQNMPSRHVNRFNHNRADRRDRHHYNHDNISFKRSAVLVPLILPPFPPPPLVFPGMHILFHSLR